MKRFRLPLFMAALLAGTSLSATTHTVVLDPAINGSFTVTPPLPASGHVDAGTVLTITPEPASGYVVDAVYYSVPGRWGEMYHETLTAPFEVVVDRDKNIGASFISASAVEHVDVRHNIVYAQPGVKPLKYDVYSPKRARGLPIIVIIHGGGWTSNEEDIMRGLARELTRGGQFVVASIDYRWAGKADGDATNNTMVNLIEDCYGAIAHIMEHAADYGGDPTRLGVTGDSAGGHLSASISLMVERVGDGGFGQTPGVFEFKPTYLPTGKPAAPWRPAHP
jgi:hypothetical protein